MTNWMLTVLVTMVGAMVGIAIIALRPAIGALAVSIWAKPGMARLSKEPM